MNDFSKVKPSHTQRAAFVYIRQSSPSQVDTTVSPPLASTLWSRKPARWAGPRNKSSSSTKIWVYPVLDR